MLKIFILSVLVLLVFSCTFKKKNYLKTEIRNIYKPDYSDIDLSSEGHTIKIAFQNLPDSLNPFLVKSEIEVLLKNALFPALFYINPETEMPEKNLLTLYDLSDDKKVLRLSLNQNITFNNGSSIDANDVKATLSLLDKELKDSLLYKAFFAGNKSFEVKVLNANTLEIVTERPDVNLLFALSRMPVLPEEFVKQISESSDNFLNLWKNIDLINQISAGPFVIKNYSDEAIELGKNKNYFKREASGKSLPLTDSIVLKIYQNNNKKIISFSENDADILPVDKKEFNDLYDFFKNKKHHVVVNAGNRNETATLFLNSFAESKASEFLKDIENRKIIVKIILKNVERKIKKNKKNEYVYRDDLVNLKNIDYKALKSDLTFRIIIPSDNPELLIYVNSFIKALRKYKIKAEVAELSSALFFERLWSKKNYEIAFFNYQSDYGLSFFSNVLSKKTREESVLFDFLENQSLLSSFSGLFEDFDFKTFSDKKKNARKEFFNDFQLIPVYSEKKVYILKKDILNFKVKTGVLDGFDLLTLEYIIKK